jgi:hypothetical protein
MRSNTLAMAALILSPCLLLSPCAMGGTPEEKPETVLITYHAKAGAEGELGKVIAKHWKTAREANLVIDKAHVVVSGTEAGAPYFVEILTWRDAGIPDAAPAPIQAIWTEMRGLVESRGGKPGIQIALVSLSTP